MDKIGGGGLNAYGAEAVRLPLFLDSIQVVLVKKSKHWPEQIFQPDGTPLKIPRRGKKPKKFKIKAGYTDFINTLRSFSTLKINKYRMKEEEIEELNLLNTLQTPKVFYSDYASCLSKIAMFIINKDVPYRQTHLPLFIENHFQLY